MNRLSWVAAATLLVGATAHSQNRLMLLAGGIKDNSSASRKEQNLTVGMNRDCGIVGSGDETAALNTCIANLPDNTGVLQCDKPGMIIHSNGVVVRNHVGIRIEANNGGHTLGNGCQIIYTGAAGGTVIDVQRTRDSVLFKGFTIYAGAADIGIQTGQTGSGGNIATSDSFEEIQLINNTGRSTFVGFMIGDSTAQNNDEMKFNHVYVGSQSCTKCGTAFKSVLTNVYGTEFRDIALNNIGVGWDTWGNATVNKVGGSFIGLLYKLAGNSTTFSVQAEDIEHVDQILLGGAGNFTFTESNGRVILNVPRLGGVTGTPGHPAWDNSAGGHVRIRNITTGCCGTFLNGGVLTTADVDFADAGITTYGWASSRPPANAINWLARDFLSAGPNSVSPWMGRGLIDVYGQALPVFGIQMTGSGPGGSSQLRSDFSPCAKYNICLHEGEIEFTGVHSILNTPTISYSGAAGSRARYYAVVACDDASCAAGHRSIPSQAVGNTATRATLDGNNYIRLTWTPALGANKYGILQQQVGSPNNWNLLMSNISCSTNPCMVVITTDSSEYNWTYPTYNETAGVTLRGVVTGKAKATFDGISTGTAGSRNKAVCWKDSSHLGYCSTQPDSTGSCTCN